ncbi:hypothetical protein FACS189426_12620 [Bacteroidia bacterium]|nr:hypothetical protein FACS189426_12620 [Bacteroidia bacterium]
MGLTIAKEVKAEKEYINHNSSDHRIETKRKLQEIAYGVLAKAKSPIELVAELRKCGIEVEPVKNKQGSMYGVRFCYKGETFKTSEVGREFGFRSIFSHFGQTPKEQSVKLFSMRLVANGGFALIYHFYYYICMKMIGNNNTR